MAKSMDPLALSMASDLNRRFDMNSDIYKYFQNSVVKNDVFLNQNSHLFEDFGNSENNNPFIDHKNEELFEDTLTYKREDFDMFLDDLCLKESAKSLSNHSNQVFGCVCCDSCQLKSQDFMDKTNTMIDELRHELFVLKDSMREQLSDINTLLNTTRLKFAKLLVDLQIKLDQKNNQLEKVLDLSQLLLQTNDYLISDHKKSTIQLENVCKDNIKHRNQLGIELKVSLNRDDCDNYLKELESKKKLINSNIDNVINKVIDCEVIKTITNTNNTINNKIKESFDLKVEVKKEPMLCMTYSKASPIRSPTKANPFSSPSKANPFQSPSKANPFRSPSKANHTIHNVIQSTSHQINRLKDLSDFKNCINHSNSSNNVMNKNEVNSQLYSMVCRTITKEQLTLSYEEIFSKHKINGFSDKNVKKRPLNSESVSPKKIQNFAFSSQSRIDGKCVQLSNDNKRFRENRDQNI